MVHLANTRLLRSFSAMAIFGYEGVGTTLTDDTRFPGRPLIKIQARFESDSLVSTSASTIVATLISDRVDLMSYLYIRRSPRILFYLVKIVAAEGNLSILVGLVVRKEISSD